jgi:hypothetical protein
MNDELVDPGEALKRRKHDRKVIIRDLAVFQIKLLLDGLKDIIISPLAIGAAAFDILAPTSRRGERFYRVMHLGEKFDHWLNLFGASQAALQNEGGLFSASRAGADSLLGKLEEMVIGRQETEAEAAQDAANTQH